MAIDPKLVSIKEAKDLPTAEAQSTSDFLFFEDQVLKKSPMSNIYDKVTSGIKGTATQTNAPTPSVSFEIWKVATPLTLPNSWGFAVTQAELDANFVYFNVTNGVVSKELSAKTVANPAKIVTWTATTYASGAQVVKDGKLYESNAATLATDIPESSSKWVEKLNAYVLKADKTVVLTYAQLQSGILTNVGAESATTLWKRTDFIATELNDVINYNLQTTPENSAIFLYDANKVFLRSLLPNTTAHQIFNGSWTNTYTDVKFIRVITLSDTNPSYQSLTFNFTLFRKSDFTKITDLTTANTARIIPLENILTDKTTSFLFANLQSGVLTNVGVEQAASTWKRTDFIAIKKNDVINYTLQLISGNNTLFLYDANKVFLRAVIPNETGSWQLMSGSWINTYDDVKFVRAITLNTTHANYQVIAYNLQVINKGTVTNLNDSTLKNANDIATVKSEDLELKLAHLLISRDEQIAKIEAGDYGVIVNGNDFTTGTQTERLQAAIAFIKKMGKGVLELTKDTVTDSFIWYMTEALLMPSNFTLLVREGVTLKKQNGIFDNLLRNDGIVPNPLAIYGKASQLNQNENIHIILADTAYINDLDVPKNAPHPINGGANVDWHRDYFGWRTLTLLFANCKNYSVKGGNFNNGRCWSISNESGCENFVYDQIDFRTYMINGDGIDVRMGCKNFVIKNITGATVDDLVAMTCLNNTSENVLPIQVGGLKYIQNSIYEPTIENGIVYNIEGMSVNHLVLVLCSGTLTKMNNIRIGKVNQVPAMATIAMTPINSVIEVFTGYYTPYATMGQMSNIYINDVVNRKSPWGAIRIDVPLQDAHFNKLNSVSTIPAVSYSTKYVEGANVFVTNVKQNATL